MPTAINRNTLQRMLEEVAQLVEVLPPGEYAEDHPPGAINTPPRTPPPRLPIASASSVRARVQL